MTVSAPAADPSSADVPVVTCDAPVKKVVVYTDRAQVTRMGKIEYTDKSPEVSVVFNNLPVDADRNSIQVAGLPASCTLKSVQVKKTVTEMAPPSEERKALNVKIEALEKQIAELQDEQRNNDEDLKTIKSMSEAAIGAKVSTACPSAPPPVKARQISNNRHFGKTSQPPQLQQIQQFQPQQQFEAYSNNNNNNNVDYCSHELEALLEDNDDDSQMGAWDYHAKAAEVVQVELKKTGQPFVFDVEKFSQLLEFRKENELATAAKNRELAEKIRLLKIDQKKLVQERSALSTTYSEERMAIRDSVHVLVQVPGPMTMSVELSYVILSARWVPKYDLRANAADKSMDLSYFGLVSQTSHEDWLDVEVQLSTAKPQLGGKQPNLKPWHVSTSYHHGQPYGMSKGGKKRKGGPSHNRRGHRANRWTAEANADGAFDSAEDDEEVDYSDSGSDVSSDDSLADAAPAEVSSQGTSAVFAIPGMHSIPSGATDPIRVPILRRIFPAAFRYSTVPKHAPQAYLKAKVINSTEFPFLAGQASVYLNGAYVTSSSLETVTPTGEFWVFLGVDESITVKHIVVKKQVGTEAYFMSAKRKKRVYEFRIDITNTKTTDEEVVVWDQLPITGEKELKVNLIEPRLNENNKGDGAKKNKQEMIEWFKVVKSGAKISIPFSFTVEYPADANPSGL